MVNRNQPPSDKDLAAFSEEMAQQYMLEKWWVEDERQRAVEKNSTRREMGMASEDRGVQGFIVRLAEKLAFEIEDRLLQPRYKTQSVIILKKITQEIEPFELAYLVLAYAVNAVMASNKGFITMQAMVAGLADVLDDEMRMRAMVKLEPEIPAIIAKLTKGSRAGLKHRRRLLINIFHKRANTRVPWTYDSNDTKIRVGRVMAELLCTHPGQLAVKAEKSYIHKRRDLQWSFKPGEELLKVFYRDLEIGWLARRVAPLGIMLYEPAGRLPGEPEMLLTRDVEPIKVNRLGGKRQEAVDVLAKEDYGYSTLLSAITHLEQVPMRINTQMLEFVRDNKEFLQDAKVLIRAEKNIPDSPIPPDLQKEQLTEDQHQRLREWKRISAKEHRDFWVEAAQVIKQNRAISLAGKLAGYDKFYYRWYADFRGRLYPLNNVLHFQTSSLGKSLLLFAEEAYIEDVGYKDDVVWRELVEYGLRLRKEYTKAPTPQIQGLFSDRKYLEGLVAEFSDNIPGEFLALGDVEKKNYLPYAAWCLEMREHLALWGQPSSSGHPVRKDATCSSMQHMAALAGDKRVLEMTNCTPKAERVSDLYTEIVPDYKELGLDRDWVKQFVMTWAYNSTDYERKKSLVAAFAGEMGAKDYMPEAEWRLHYARAQEVNTTLKEAANKGLGRIIPLQQVFMEVFRLMVVKGKHDALSITPTEFVVDSTKVDYPHKVYNIKYFDRRIQFKMKDIDSDNLKVIRSKTQQAWVANIIHSLDAALLHMYLATASEVGRKRGTKFHCATIHDCIVTRPGDMDLSVAVLGMCFGRMYAPNEKEKGMPAALERLLEFWGVDTDHPKLYNRCKRLFKALPETYYQDMRYFFI